MKLPRLGEFRVLTLREEPPTVLCDTPELAAQYWREHIMSDPRYNGDVESMWGLALSTRRKVLGCYLVATGTLDTILCHPREVFRPAIVANAASIVVGHNHPSGDPSPSEADIRITRDLIKAGQLLKIDVLDHIIMGQIQPEGNIKGYVSLRELGYFYS